MQGIFTILCQETENNYLGRSRHAKKALEKTIALLEANKHFSKDLQQEWNEYGREAFEAGCPYLFENEEWDAGEELDLVVEEWMDILENVEYLGAIDEESGERLDDTGK